jgi:hypothetical protein
VWIAEDDLAGLRASRAVMTLSIARLSVRSSAIIFDSFKSFSSPRQKMFHAPDVQQCSAAFVALEQ